MNTGAGFGVKIARNVMEKRVLKTVENWVRNHVMSLGVSDIQIMVTEVQCNDANCVPIETLIILVGSSGKWSEKILKPSAEVNQGDVAAISFPKDLSFILNTAVELNQVPPIESSITVVKMIWTTDAAPKITSMLGPVTAVLQGDVVMRNESKQSRSALSTTVAPASNNTHEAGIEDYFTAVGGSAALV
jgi:hypothetical protein